MKKFKKINYLFLFLLFFIFVNLISFYKIISFVGVSIFEHEKYQIIKANFTKDTKGTLPHPFLGYTATKQIPLVTSISNEPMFHSISKKPKKNEVKILILGGSVASHLSKGGVEVEDQIFAKTLNNHFNTDRFVVYNAAVGGYKQPQQVFKFVYLNLAGFNPDLVINLDGFNEISETISYNEAQKTPATFPYIYPTALKLGADDRSCVSLNNALLKINTNIPLLELISWAYVINCHNKIVGEPLNKPWWHNIINTKSQTTEEYALASVRIWEASSNFLHNTLNSKNITYIHVLQPNQYVKNSKIYSDKELKLCLNSKIYGDPIKNYYQLLNSKNLKTKNFIDERMLFKDISQTIYMDDCCHMNNRGMDLLSRDIIHKKHLLFEALLSNKKSNLN